MAFSKEYWLDGAVEVDFVPGMLQSDMPITAVGAFAFTQPGHMVLAKNHRGWDNPGGHIEENETVLEALHREVAEEINGRIVGEPVLIGHRHAKTLRPHAWSHKYPPEAALPIYFAFVELEDFTPQFEVTDRMVAEMTQAIEHYHAWSEQRDEIFAHAKRHHPHFFSD